MTKPFLGLGKKSSTDADAYFAEGEAWGQEIYDSLRRSNKLAWTISGVSTLAAVMAIGAVMMLTPLKTVESHVYAVDKTTGYMERMDNVVTGTINANEAIARSDVIRFLQSHEIWDPTDFQERARFVRLNANDQVYRLYLDTINERAENLDNQDQRTVHIKSISMNMLEKTGFVRFSTDTKNEQLVREEHWVAAIEFKYTATPPNRDIAIINPLGFQVTRFRVDQENVKEAEQ